MEEVRFYEDVAGPRHGATGLRGETLVTLQAAGLNADDVARAVRAALDEDFAYGPDVTSAATVAGRTVTADVVAREAGVLAGMPVALAVLDLIGCYLDGPAASWRLSPAVAGAGRHPAAGGGRGAAGERARPGGAGGGADDAQLPHPPVGDRDRDAGLGGRDRGDRSGGPRHQEDDARAAGAREVRGAVRGRAQSSDGARRRRLDQGQPRGGGGRGGGRGDGGPVGDGAFAGARPASGRPGSGAGSASAGAGLVVEVECDSVAQVREALEAGAHFLLLDNMPVGSLREAVAVAREYYGVRLEASGGLRLANAREVAETGVDYLSVGALTHSSPALDLALDYAEES